MHGVKALLLRDGGHGGLNVLQELDLLERVGQHHHLAEQTDEAREGSGGHSDRLRHALITHERLQAIETKITLLF